MIRREDLDVTAWESTSGVGLTLTRDEALILRSAAYLHAATCAVEREEARRQDDLLGLTRWSTRHDIAKQLGDRLERLVASGVESADVSCVSHGSPTLGEAASGSTPEPTPPGSGAPVSPAVTNTPAAGDVGACHDCGMPDGETFAGGRIILCGTCREKLHSAIAADLGLAPRVEGDDEYLVAACEICDLTVTSRFWLESKRVCWGCWNRAQQKRMADARGGA